MTDEEILKIIRGLQVTSGGSDDVHTQGDGSNRTPMGPPITAPGTNAGLIGPPVTVPPSGVPAGTNPMEFFLRSTPGYDFAFKENQRAAQTGAAARGTLLTGGTLKALARYGQGLADQTYNTAVSHRLSLADIGARTATAPF
jgi:hypothetical protein